MCYVAHNCFVNNDFSYFSTTNTYNLVIVHPLKVAKASYNKNLTEH
jgi:hypothetical protein